MIDKSCPHCTQLHRSNTNFYGSAEPSFATTVSRQSHARRKDRSPTTMSDELISTLSNGTTFSAGSCHRFTTSACISTRSVYQTRAEDQWQCYTILAESPPDWCSGHRESIPYEFQSCPGDSVDITNQTSALTLLRRLNDRIGCARSIADGESVEEEAGEVQQDCRCYCPGDSITNEMASSSTKLKLKKSRLRQNSNNASMVVSAQTIRTAIFGTPVLFYVALVIGLQLIASMRGVSAATSDISLLRHIRDASNAVTNSTPVIPRMDENGSKYSFSFTICIFSI